MIDFLWFNTYWFPAIVFMGSLISVLWLTNKGADMVDRVVKNTYRVIFHAYNR